MKNCLEKEKLDAINVSASTRMSQVRQCRDGGPWALHLDTDGTQQFASADVVVPWNIRFMCLSNAAVVAACVAMQYWEKIILMFWVSVLGLFVCKCKNLQGQVFFTTRAKQQADSSTEAQINFSGDRRYENLQLSAEIGE